MMVFFLASMLGACAKPTTFPPGAVVRDVPANRPQEGATRDAQGCIPSAGYSWCARTQSCERPQELTAAKGLKNDRETFDRYCRTTTNKSTTKAKKHAKSSR